MASVRLSPISILGKQVFGRITHDSVRIFMEQCWACGKTFATSQGRKAHQKTCRQYRAHRAQQAALGTPRLRQPLPQAGKIDSTPPSRSPQTAISQPPDPFTTTLDLLKHNGTVPSGTDSTSKIPAQQRRASCRTRKRRSSTSIGAHRSPLLRK